MTESIKAPWHESKLELATNVKDPVTGKGKRTAMGFTDAFIPSLDMLPAITAPDSVETGEDGTVSINYKDPILAFMQKALTAAILAPVRSAVQWAKNADGEPEYNGQASSAADNWDTFLEASGGTGFLAIKATWIKYFRAYVQAQELPAVAKDKLLELVESGKYISGQKQLAKDRVRAQIEQFMEVLEADTAEEVKVYTSKMYAYLDAEVDTSEDAFGF